jgi:hypothetical protein
MPTSDDNAAGTIERAAVTTAGETEMRFMRAERTGRAAGHSLDRAAQIRPGRSLNSVTAGRALGKLRQT